MCVAHTTTCFSHFAPEHFSIFVCPFPFDDCFSAANRWRASGDFLTASSANLDVLQAQAALLGPRVCVCVGCCCCEFSATFNGAGCHWPSPVGDRTASRLEVVAAVPLFFWLLSPQHQPPLVVCWYIFFKKYIYILQVWLCVVGWLVGCATFASFRLQQETKTFFQFNSFKSISFNYIHSR